MMYRKIANLGDLAISVSVFFSVSEFFNGFSVFFSFFPGEQKLFAGLEVFFYGVQDF